MSDEDEVARVVVAALINASINFPDLADGTTRNAVFRDTEESLHLAHAVIESLRKAGFEIRKVSKNAKGIKDQKRR